MPSNTPRGYPRALGSDNWRTYLKTNLAAGLDLIDADMTTALGASVPGDNLLVNPGFEVWQRGAGAFTATGAYAADRWYLSLSGSTMSVTRITSTVGFAGFSAQLVVVHTTYAMLDQALEDYIQLKGKQVTFALTVKSTVAGRVRIGYDDGVGGAYSAYNVGTGEERLSVTFTVSASATRLWLRVRMDTGNCTVEVNDAALALGATAMAYTPMHPADDLVRCLRYYQIYGGANDGVVFFYGYGGAGASKYHAMGQFPVEMAVTPTVTKSGTWQATNCGQPTVVANKKGWAINLTVTALGDYQSAASGAGQTAEFVANP